MENLHNQIHLKNILSCIGEIESICADLTCEQLEDEEFRMMLYRHLTMMGMEAGQVSTTHPAISTLKSFEKADYINGLGRDTYAISHFIINDLDFIKSSICTLLAKSHKSRPARNKLALA